MLAFDGTSGTWDEFEMLKTRLLVSSFSCWSRDEGSGRNYVAGSRWIKILLSKKDSNGCLWIGHFVLLKAVSATQESTAERGPSSTARHGTYGWVICHKFLYERACLFFTLRLSNSICKLLYTICKSSICLLGNEVVIVKSGKRICGSGAALANAAILQNKCYFEMKIQSGGKEINKELCFLSKSDCTCYHSPLSPVNDKMNEWIKTSKYPKREPMAMSVY